LSLPVPGAIKLACSQCAVFTGFSQYTCICVLMDNRTRSNSRQWKIHCWNIRSLNAQHKWSMLRSKILEVKCDIICLQETKREVFDRNYIKKFCPAQFDCFEYYPSIGASGGTIIIWKSSRFASHVIFQNSFSMSIEFNSTISDDQWVLTNIYATCTPDGKQQFLDWLHNIDIDDEVEWLLVGDFNLIHRPSDRNKPGGNMEEML
jgi:exonuclease III